MKKLHLSVEVKLKAIHAVKVLGQSVSQVSKTLGIDRRTIYHWFKKGNSTKQLTRKNNPLSGRQSKILGENLKEIIEIIKKPASEYGYDTNFWTTTRLIFILKKILNLKVSRMAIFTGSGRRQRRRSGRTRVGSGCRSTPSRCPRRCRCTGRARSCTRPRATGWRHCRSGSCSCSPVCPGLAAWDSCLRHRTRGEPLRRRSIPICRHQPGYRCRPPCACVR